jgi:hypothetical protein
MKKLGILSFTLIVSALAACGDDEPAGTDAGIGTDLGVSVDLGSMLDIGVQVVDGGSDAGPGACAAFCSTMQTTCTGVNVQFADEAACLAACETNNKWPAGTEGATSGDSFACRQYHLGAAATDANTHCIHAGPTGGGTCGTLCENMCQLAASNCTSTNAIYASMEECLLSCSEQASDGEVNATAGDTVQCRIYHLGVAGSSVANALTHCPHGADNGGGVCVTL